MGLGIEVGAQVNFINKVNTNVFSVDENKQLDLIKVPVGKLEGLGEEFTVNTETNTLNLVKVPVGKIDGLTDWIENSRNTVEGLYPETAATLLSTLDDTINHKETGLIVELTAVKARVLTNENSIKDHADRLDALEYAMTWHELEQNNI